MIIGIVGIVIGLMVLIAGIYYLVKEKTTLSPRSYMELLPQ